MYRKQRQQLLFSENHPDIYRRMLILRVTKNPMVTAGLMCPPLTCAITQTIVATLRPNDREIRTTSPVVHEPQATSTSRNVPRNSANNANQNLHDFTSCTLVVDIFTLICTKQQQQQQPPDARRITKLLKSGYSVRKTEGTF